MKNFFQLPTDQINMNSGTQNSYPVSVRDFIFEHKEKYRANPTLGHFDFVPAIWKAQKQMAAFFNLDPNDFFFCHNVTEALNHFILGLDKKILKRIVTTDLEYGATVNICQYRSENEAIPLIETSFEKYLEDGFINYEKYFEELESTLQKDDLYVVSHIMTSNGDILPLKKIGDICKRKGARVAVDGAHAPGAIKLDFSEFSNIDFYGGNLHKWMMGPAGTGFGWINPKSKDYVKCLTAGWPTYDNAFHLEGHIGSGTSKQFYLKGTFDFANFMGIGELLNFWDEIGEEKIYQTRFQLRKLLLEKMNNTLGWKLLSPHWETSPLITFETPEKISQMGWDFMVNLWNEHGIIVSTPKHFGKHVLRLSPNIYNDESDIEKTVAALKAAND
ncbi:MAG: aminotransferase class V-fold PLP-dependent enzyme [Deltaproteobacteria bacterium]|nr:MAG: aminotransferase class V-fold PLP-dependent enzyme [Deltaproteobacteria bacterium]